MDSRELFRQLTRGVKFRKPPRPAPQPADEKTPNAIQEISERETTPLNCHEEEEPRKFEFISPAFVKEISEGRLAKKATRSKVKQKLSPEQLAKQENELRIQRMRQDHRITVFGKHIPAPLHDFHELNSLYGVEERLLKNVETCQYREPTPIQRQALPVLMERRNILACAPTGSGKTLAFLLPILHNLGGPKTDGFRALVMAPTRELAQQIYRECVRFSEKTGLKVHIIGKVQEAQQKFSGTRGKHCDIFISTPKRIIALLEVKPKVLDMSSVEWFVMDEADRLMEGGKDQFKEQLEVILKACTNPKKKLALFSATSTVPVTKWALRHLKDLIRVHVGLYNAATETVQQELMFVGSERGKLLAIRDMAKTGLKPPVLIFLQSKERAQQLFDELFYDGINVDVIHSDRSQQQRENTIRAFREGKVWVLICTELLARGIDFKGVNLVINYDFPPSTIAYVHRVGRTGRAGRPGRAITFFTHNDTAHLRSIAEIVKNSGGKVPDFMLKLKAPSKTEKRKLAHSAPEREDILTKLPKLERDKKKVIVKKPGDSKTKEEVNTKTVKGLKTPARTGMTPVMKKKTKENGVVTHSKRKIVQGGLVRKPSVPSLKKAEFRTKLKTKKSSFE